MNMERERERWETDRQTDREKRQNMAASTHQDMAREKVVNKLIGEVTRYGGYARVGSDWSTTVVLPEPISMVCQTVLSLIQSERRSAAATTF